jgi:hypothetical protein
MSEFERISNEEFPQGGKSKTSEIGDAIAEKAREPA